LTFINGKHVGTKRREWDSIEKALRNSWPADVSTGSIHINSRRQHKVIAPKIRDRQRIVSKRSKYFIKVLYIDKRITCPSWIIVISDHETVPVHHITIRDSFAFAHKLSPKEPPPSDWPALASSNWIVSVGKALDGAAFLIMPDRWRETVQEA
jgi:hypothetical protein